MYIGVYFCLCEFFILLSLLVLTSIRKQSGSFILASGISTLSGLLMFELSSNYFNLINLKEPVSFNFPRDYLSQGFAGWTIIIIPILGITSPLIIAFLMDKRRTKSE